MRGETPTLDRAISLREGVMISVFVHGVVLALILSASLRARVRVFIGNHFFSYRYDYREEWLKFTRTLTAPVDARPIEEVCVRALADLVESTGGGLWHRRG